MAHPLEVATLAAVKEHENFKKQITALTDTMRGLEREVDKRDGEIAELRRQLVEYQERHDRELVASQDRGDHLLCCNTELIKQLQNINMFVNDAVSQAKIEIERQGIEVQEKRIKQLTDDFKKEADVDLNELESTILQQSINGKSVDNRNAAV